MNEILLPAVPAPDRQYTSSRKEGYEAFSRDLTRRDNPYPIGTRRRTDWLSGWLRANDGLPLNAASESEHEKADPRASMRAHTRAMFEGMRRAA
jgi:hypothetical protein